MIQLDKENPILINDLRTIIHDDAIPWAKLNNQTILVTGATGLIGGLLIKAILVANFERNRNIRVVALVRNISLAREIFKNYLDDSCLEFLLGDVESLPEIDGVVDYVVHAASQTQSRYFIEKPVETIKTSWVGTDNVLRLANAKKIKSLVHLSSMEVYGDIRKSSQIKEDDYGYIDLLEARSSYSESKRASENLCYAYFKEYQVPVKIARLTLTFGPGVSKLDNRVFAQFCAKIRNKENIVLHTSGASKRDYLYTSDAIAALLVILLKGESGDAYNVANNKTYISIFDMAKLVSQNFGGGVSQVVVSPPKDIHNYGYAPTLEINLDTQKIQAIGWRAKVDLVAMYSNLLRYYDAEINSD